MNTMENIKRYRLCVQYLVIAVVIYLMIVSFIGPWWTSAIVNTPGGPTVNMKIEIFQWGIPKGYFSEFFQPDITPVYQVWLARLFLALSIFLLLVSPWLRPRISRLITGTVGVSWLLYTCGGLYLIYTRTSEYGIPLEGSETVFDYVFVIVATSSFEPSFYFAIAAGILCIILCLTLNLIVNKKGF